MQDVFLSYGSVRVPQEAVELSRTSSNAYVDRGVQEQAEAWRDALLEGDQVLAALAVHGWGGRGDEGAAGAGSDGACVLLAQGDEALGERKVLVVVVVWGRGWSSTWSRSQSVLRRAGRFRSALARVPPRAELRRVHAQAESARAPPQRYPQDALQDVLQHLLAHQQRSAAPRGPQAEDEAEEQEDEHVDAIDEEAGPQDGAAGTAWAAPPSGQLPSPQQLRALVRQCQQARAELQQLQAPLAPASSNSFVGPGVGRGGQSGGGGDEDDLQSVLAEAAARARRRNKGGGGGSPAQEEASAAAAPARGGRGAGAGAAAVVDAAVGAASPALDAALRKSRLLNRSLYGVLRALAQAAGQEA